MHILERSNCIDTHILLMFIFSGQLGITSTLNQHRFGVEKVISHRVIQCPKVRIDGSVQERRNFSALAINVFLH